MESYHCFHYHDTDRAWSDTHGEVTSFTSYGSNSGDIDESVLQHLLDGAPIFCRRKHLSRPAKDQPSKVSSSNYRIPWRQSQSPQLRDHRNHKYLEYKENRAIRKKEHRRRRSEEEFESAGSMTKRKSSGGYSNSTRQALDRRNPRLAVEAGSRHSPAQNLPPRGHGHGSGRREGQEQDSRASPQHRKRSHQDEIGETIEELVSSSESASDEGVEVKREEAIESGRSKDKYDKHARNPSRGPTLGDFVDEKARSHTITSTQSTSDHEKGRTRPSDYNRMHRPHPPPCKCPDCMEVTQQLSYRKRTGGTGTWQTEEVRRTDPAKLKGRRSRSLDSGSSVSNFSESWTSSHASSATESRDLRRGRSLEKLKGGTEQRPHDPTAIKDARIGNHLEAVEHELQDDEYDRDASGLSPQKESRSTREDATHKDKRITAATTRCYSRPSSSKTKGQDPVSKPLPPHPTKETATAERNKTVERVQNTNMGVQRKSNYTQTSSSLPEKGSVNPPKRTSSIATRDQEHRPPPPQEQQQQQSRPGLVGRVYATAAGFAGSMSKCSTCSTARAEVREYKKVLKEASDDFAKARDDFQLKLSVKDDEQRQILAEKDSLTLELAKAQSELMHFKETKQAEISKCQDELKALQEKLLHRKTDLSYSADDPTIKDMYQNICRKVTNFFKTLIRYDSKSEIHFEVAILLDSEHFISYLEKLFPNQRIALLIFHLLDLRSRKERQPVLLHDLISAIVMNILAEEVFERQLRALDDDLHFAFNRLFLIVKDFNQDEPERLAAAMAWRSDLFRMLRKESLTDMGAEEYPVEYRTDNIIEDVCAKIVKVLNPLFRNFKSSVSEHDFKLKTRNGLQNIVQLAINLTAVLARQRADYRLQRSASIPSENRQEEAEGGNPALVVWPGLVKYGDESARNYHARAMLIEPKVIRFGSREVNELINGLHEDLLEEEILRKAFLHSRRVALPNHEVISELRKLLPPKSSLTVSAGTQSSPFNTAQNEPGSHDPRKFYGVSLDPSEEEKEGYSLVSASTDTQEFGNRELYDHNHRDMTADGYIPRSKLEEARGYHFPPGRSGARDGYEDLAEFDTASHHRQPVLRKAPGFVPLQTGSEQPHQDL